MHPAALDERDLLASCELRRERRSGPGGQHRNKVETAVVITHRPTGIQGEASERRSQAQNRQRALHRLRVNLALAIREAVPNRVPSTVWQERSRSGRVAINREHQHFPTMLAEALDMLYAVSLSPREAALRLGCTSSQLVKLLRSEPRALEQVNRARQDINLPKLL